MPHNYSYEAENNPPTSPETRGRMRPRLPPPLRRTARSPPARRPRAGWPHIPLSANTRAAYTRAVRQFDAWRGAAPATDATLAAYLGALFEQGRAPATAALAVAAVTFRAALTTDTIRGPLTDRVLAGFRRDGADRGRESARIAARRAALDKALAAVLFQGALRRSEAAALEWRDVAPATTAGAILLTVRRSKTDLGWFEMTAQPLLQFGAVALDPAPDGRVVGLQTTLAEQLFDIAERERVPEIPAYGA